MAHDGATLIEVQVAAIKSRPSTGGTTKTESPQPRAHRRSRIDQGNVAVEGIGNRSINPAARGVNGRTRSALT